MGNTFGPKGFSSGSRTRVSRSKYPKFVAAILLRVARLDAFDPNPEKGRHYWNKRTGEALRKAISYFNQAIETDPLYALAHAELADCYVPLGYWTFLAPQDSFPRAKAANEKALQLDPTFADAHAVLGGVNMCSEWRWQQGEADLKRAIELNSNYPRAHQIYAELLTVMGEFDRASSEAQLAIELDPLAPAAYFGAGLVMYCARQYAQALNQREKALEIDPDFFPAHLVAGLVFEREGRFANAIESLERRGDHRAEVFSFEPCSAERSPLQDDRMMHAQCYVNSNNTQQRSMCHLYLSPSPSLHWANMRLRLPVWTTGCDSVAHEQSGARSIRVLTSCVPTHATPTCCDGSGCRSECWSKGPIKGDVGDVYVRASDPTLRNRGRKAAQKALEIRPLPNHRTGKGLR